MNKLAIITGASSGLGKEYAYAYAKQKYDLILIARNEKNLQEIEMDIKQKYLVACKYIICDLSNLEEINLLCEKIKLEKTDVLINNAGFGEKQPYHLTDTKKIKNMINVHILATTLLSRCALDYMIKKNKGTIINVSSIAGYLYSSKSNIIYNSTKRYIIHFSINLQNELNALNKNIKIQALCPGLTNTNFNKSKIFETIRRKIPSFMYMEADEVIRQSINALSKKRVVFIPGFKNKVLSILLKLFF